MKLPTANRVSKLFKSLYSPSPLAQTGMTGTDINAKAVAPGRAYPLPPGERVNKVTL